LNMQVKLFTIPVSDSGVFTDELNRFLRSNKILEVESHLISNEKGAAWCFCVKFIDGTWPQKPEDRTRVDYKNELDEVTFEIFSRLRIARKKLAADEAIPAYAVCTDQELAEMAKLKELTVNNLTRVKGFGEKKLEKYGNRLLQLFHELKDHEAGG